ncbi:MAG: hypothetical protein ACYTGG_12245 [Planctomycetota bacterium]|jgi:hypothetical protein
MDQIRHVRTITTWTGTPGSGVGAAARSDSAVDRFIRALIAAAVLVVAIPLAAVVLLVALVVAAMLFALALGRMLLLSIRGRLGARDGRENVRVIRRPDDPE